MSLEDSQTSPVELGTDVGELVESLERVQDGPDDHHDDGSTPADDPDDTETIIASIKHLVAIQINQNKENLKNICELTSGESREESKMSVSDSDDDDFCCKCETVPYGNMVLCCYDQCDIEWYHFGCVNMETIPEGEWYCPRCRGKESCTLRTTLMSPEHNY